MKREIITHGKTIEAAVDIACEQFGVKPEDVTYEVLEEPKKGFLGMGAVQARVKVTYRLKPSEIAVNFVKTLLADMEIEAQVSHNTNNDGDLVIKIVGDPAGVLIGHHGETLDTIQYIVNLAANRKESAEDKREYTRIVLDVEGYREKREDTVRSLARKLASRVKKSGRSVKLEPMSAQERRVIHSEIQKIPGVTTFSIGQEPKRRIVVAIDRNDNSATEKSVETEE